MKPLYPFSQFSFPHTAQGAAPLSPKNHTVRLPIKISIQHRALSSTQRHADSALSFKFNITYSKQLKQKDREVLGCNYSRKEKKMEKGKEEKKRKKRKERRAKRRKKTKMKRKKKKMERKKKKQ